MNDLGFLQTQAIELQQLLHQAGTDPVLSPQLAERLAGVQQELQQAGREQAQRAAFTALLQVVEITTEIFGGEVRIKSAANPEFPGDKYVCLTAEIAGGNETILAQEAEWARRIASIKPVWDGFKLRVKRKK